MEGNNTLIFCQADMVKAIQTYLSEHVFAQDVKVNSVSMCDAMLKSFKIEFGPKEETT